MLKKARGNIKLAGSLTFDKMDTHLSIYVEYVRKGYVVRPALRKLWLRSMSIYTVYYFPGIKILVICNFLSLHIVDISIALN
jgi:hypothetical protein